MALRGTSVRSFRDGSLDRSFKVDSFSYFSFQPVRVISRNTTTGVTKAVLRVILDANPKE